MGALVPSDLPALIPFAGEMPWPSLQGVRPRNPSQGAPSCPLRPDHVSWTEGESSRARGSRLHSTSCPKLLCRPPSRPSPPRTRDPPRPSCCATCPSSYASSAPSCGSSRGRRGETPSCCPPAPQGPPCPVPAARGRGGGRSSLLAWRSVSARAPRDPQPVASLGGFRGLPPPVLWHLCLSGPMGRGNKHSWEPLQGASLALV
ncbi:uncharacterized protein LOC115643130 [Gopherus evgoodei]|uniref:uncharacterized protein LOC115643130 n=1 Tax=Gopherus evgoodei TaxID=1825980 RepID=UPI0011D019A9|nr:uncharacterized protein LOC115643130 [Gopherus evgoodei]